MASIADLYGKLLLDDSGFEAAVVKSAGSAADKASQTMGQRVSSGLGKAFKVAGPAVGALGGLAFGAAIEGAGQLTEAVAKFRAETGATEEEARAAQATISGLYKTNTEGFEELGAVLSRVHTDLGLTGDAAAAAAQKVLDFAKVTGQDAVGAVGALDDLTDTFNLTAEQQADILDKLVVSHQKYGGSVEKNQQALVDLAPALTAANLSYDDGIGLLNLFEKAGIDAAAAPVALTKALTKVKSPDELQRLIADIQATEDPFLRASKATDLFGAKAGTKLALALSAGTAGFGEFAISTEEAAGKLDEMSDIIDKSPLNTFKLALKQVGGALADVGTNFGPLLLGFSQLGGKGLVTKATAVLGGFIGKLSTGPLLKFGKGLSGLATTFATGLSSKLGGTALADGLSSGVGGLSKSPKIAGALGKLSSFMGSKLGKGLSVAFAAIAIFEVIETYKRISAELDAQSKEIGANIGKQITAGSLESLQQSKAALEQGLQDLNGVWDAGLFTTDQRRNMEQQLADVNASIAARSAALPGTAADNLAAGQGAVTDAAETMVDGIPGAVDGAAADAGLAAQGVPTEIASGILERQSVVGSAMATLRNQIENEKTPAAQASAAIGALISEELANAMNDKREGVRLVAQSTRETAEAELSLFIAGGGKIGAAGMAALVAAEKSKDPDVRAQAARTRAIIEQGVKPNTVPAGEKAGQGVVTGLNNKSGAVGTAAYNLGKTIVRNMLGGLSNTARTKDDTYIPRRAHGGPVTAGQPYIVGEHRAELFVPSVSGTIMPDLSALMSTPSGGGGTTVNLSTYGLPMRAQTPVEVVHQLKRASRLGTITPPRRTPSFSNG